MKIRLHILAALAAVPLSFQALADCTAAEAAQAAAQAAAPAAAPAAAAVEAAPVSAPATAAAPVAATAPAGTAVITRAVALRDRPVSSSTGDIVVSADKRVRLERSVNNGEGKWWYVTASGLGGGWVLDSELGGQQL